MPTIAQLSVELTVFPNRFVSPFGNDGIIPLYSSIPVATQKDPDCLPCVVCGGSIARRKVIDTEKMKFQASRSTGVSVTVTG